MTRREVVKVGLLKKKHVLTESQKENLWLGQAIMRDKEGEAKINDKMVMTIVNHLLHYTKGKEKVEHEAVIVETKQAPVGKKKSQEESAHNSIVDTGRE